MNRILVLFLAAVFGVTGQACSQSFGDRIDKGVASSDSLDEASGIAVSRRNPEILWTHNDSGDKPRLFAMTTSAKVVGIYTLTNAENRDWEDICTGSFNGTPFIFVGDIGDNNAQYDVKTIYRIEEPFINENQAFVSANLKGAEKIRYRYPDGQRDAETLMFDAKTGDLYVVSKREDSVRVYRLAYPQSVTDIIIPEKVAVLPLQQIVAGDISVNGTAILLKNYSTVYYYQKLIGETVAQALMKAPVIVPQYQPEPQGEGLCFDWSGAGFYTISEWSAAKIPTHLYFYPFSASGTNTPAQSPSTRIDTILPSGDGNEITVKFTLAAEADVSITLTDISGKVRPLAKYPNQAAGTHTITLRTTTLASSIYRLTLQAGKEAVSEMFAIRK